MIDLVYKTLQTIINKENNGYVSPTEFNLLANKVQEEIFREYFEDENRDKNRDNRGLTNKGYGNLDFNQRQLISQFSDKKTISLFDSKIALPTDLYLIEDDGVTSPEGTVIEEIERGAISYLLKSSSKPTTLYPVYERYSNFIEIYPSTITSCVVRYIRKPKPPVWTYSVVGGKEMFNPSNTSYQDFELHSSEFSNIILRMLSAFSINLRELEITKIAEELKSQLTVKDNN